MIRRQETAEEIVMQIKTFGVIGAGQMGSGIAQVAAASGLDVVMSDISEDCIARGVASITSNLERSVTKGKLTEEEFRGYCKGNALKYLCRSAFKHDDQERDLEKASNYLIYNLDAD
jgi:UDP-N-acetyl-D-mannosaminuronate dehydrogenase